MQRKDPRTLHVNSLQLASCLTIVTIASCKNWKINIGTIHRVYSYFTNLKPCVCVCVSVYFYWSYFFNCSVSDKLFYH